MRVDLNRNRLKVTPFKGLTERVDIVVEKQHVQPLVPNSSAEFLLDPNSSKVEFYLDTMYDDHNVSFPSLSATV